MQLINIDLIKNPLNWFIVLLMIIIFAIGADVFLSHYRKITSNLNTLAGIDDKTDA